MPRIFNGSRVQDPVDDESFKFRALSASAVMAFDGQTEFDSLPSNLHYPRGSEYRYGFR